MSTSATDEIAFWNGPNGERWVREQAERDAFLAPYGEAALRAAAPAPGESVLDVGCGCGTTLLALSDAVGPGGRVLGLDVSGPMLARAKELARGRSNIAVLQADATSSPLERATFDLLFSRFGVMFFDDPVRAFTNLASALKPSGRLAFACWKALGLNAWARLPVEAAAQVVGRPAPPAPDAPGPFSFGAEERIRAILGRAGFGPIDVTPVEAPASYPTLEEAAARLARVGPAARLLADRDAATVAKVEALLRDALAPFAGAGGVRVPGAGWIVTARAPKAA